MTLPSKPLPTGSVTIEGTEVPIRGLSRAQVLHLQKLVANDEDAEPYLISAGTGVSVEEAGEWLASIDLVTGGELVEAIFRVTGLMDPQKGSTGEGPGEKP
jgi:hypothetical protein